MCSMTPILIYMTAVIWELASTSLLLPPALLAPDLDGASLTIADFVRQLHWAFNGISLPESKTRPRAEAKLYRDMAGLIPEWDWIAS